MLEQRIAEMFKGGAAQRYVPKFGPKRPDPVEATIKKTKQANVQPQEKKSSEGTKFQQITKKITAMHGSKPPITKIGEFMSSDVFAGAFMDELAGMEKGAGIISGIRKGLRTRLGTLAAGAALASAPYTAGPTLSAAYNVGGGALHGAAKTVGLSRDEMPKLPGKAEASTEHAERTVSKTGPEITAERARKAVAAKSPEQATARAGKLSPTATRIGKMRQAGTSTVLPPHPGRRQTDK